MSETSVKVLLIEDSQEHAEILQRTLASGEGSRFVLHRVGNLAEGLHHLKSSEVQLVLLDMTLPDSEGLDSFIRVLEAAPEIPVIVLSGINDVHLAVETVQLGAQDYLVKGHVDSHLLVRAMRYAIERKRAQIQLKRANDSLELRVRERTASLARYGRATGRCADIPWALVTVPCPAAPSTAMAGPVTPSAQKAVIGPRLPGPFPPPSTPR